MTDPVTGMYIPVKTTDTVLEEKTNASYINTDEYWNFSDKMEGVKNIFRP
jgi:hypothetical protein